MNTYTVKYGRAAPDQLCGSRLQIQLLKPFRRRSELAELINSRARRREGEGGKRSSQHWVEVCFWRDASESFCNLL